MRSTRTILGVAAASLALAAGAALADPGADPGKGKGDGNHGGGAAQAPSHAGGGARVPQQAKPQRPQPQQTVQARNQPARQQHKAPAPAPAPAKVAVQHPGQYSGEQAHAHGNANKVQSQRERPQQGQAPASGRGAARADAHPPTPIRTAGKAQDHGAPHMVANGAAKDMGPNDRSNGNGSAAGNRPRIAGGGHGPAQRGDVRQMRYTGPKGQSFTVPTNDRVRIVTQRQVVDWGSLNRRASYDGCPPGLAKKYNGCTPPGLARPPSYRWAQPDWYWHDDYDRDYRYRYVDGYMLRLGSGTQVMSYIPLLGGALAIGQIWPTAYEPLVLPTYYDSYYDLGPVDSYRYYGDTIYRVDPGSSAITSVLALLTGNDIAIGQPMPMGYDVYNVPYDYRDQYMDGPDAMYRYSDGYIYQLDPTTRLVQAAIELLA